MSRWPTTHSTDPLATPSSLKTSAIELRLKVQGARSSRIRAALSYAILLGGILTIGLTVYMVVVSYSPLPWGDGWAQIDPLANGINPLSLQWLWGQHDEHRLVIPKLFLIADLHFFHARQIFLLISILVIQFFHLCVLSRRVCGRWAHGAVRFGARYRPGRALFVRPGAVHNFYGA